MSVVAVGCATPGDNPMADFPLESFEAWIDVNAPTADSLAEGVYIEYYSRATNWEELPAPIVDTSWIRLNYTGYTLDGSVFETRDSTLALQLGTWVQTTHFVDDYVPYAVSNKICPGLYVALTNMRQGDIARIYISASMAYSSTLMGENSGYAGPTLEYFGYPVYFDVMVDEIVDDPQEHELDSLQRWVQANWKDKGYVVDSLAEGIYMRMILEDPTADSITSDSTVNYNWQSYFLDNHPVNTNIEDLAEEWGVYSSSVLYDIEQMTPSKFEDSLSTYQVYRLAIINMRQGEIAEAVAVSWLAAGVFGDAGAVPQILPFESLRFNIETLAKEDDTDEDEVIE